MFQLRPKLVTTAGRDADNKRAVSGSVVVANWAYTTRQTSARKPVQPVRGHLRLGPQ